MVKKIAYYNEIDPYAVEWLRTLIKEGHIAPGIVDDRSIEDVTPNDLEGFNQCHFFAGIGIWSLSLKQAGWPDEQPVWTGSCPCQPFSQAGKKVGFADQRHLWPALHWLIKQCQPDVIFGEQVPSKDGLSWFDVVQSDMEGEDYSCGVPFYAQQARACHILGKGYSGLPTPTAGEFRDFSQPQILAKLDKGGRVARWICSRSLTALSYKGTLGLNPCFARWMMGIPQEWDDCAPTETPSLRMSQKNS